MDCRLLCAKAVPEQMMKITMVSQIVEHIEISEHLTKFAEKNY